MLRCISYQIERESQEEDVSTGFASLPSIVFLLHVPADQLHQRPCYQTIPLNGWSAIYVDAFCDGLLEVDVDGDRVNAALHGYRYEATCEVIEGGCIGEVSDISVDRSPQWMRVAFFLDIAPSLLDIRREFSHLAPLAIVQAVQAISFEQKLPTQVSRARRMTLQQYLCKAGIDVSLPAYEGGDKDWVIKMFETRPYILQTLTDSFSTLWGQLVQHTVQEKCERLAMGGTTRGLVESVRASHKWLISDFMQAIVKGDLAANWGLEALASLPEGALDTPLADDRGVDSMRGDEDALYAGPREQTGDSTSADMAALTIHILKGIVAIRSNDHIQQDVQYSSVSTRVICSNSPIAPRTPLYQPLISLLERLVPKARQRSHRIRTRESVTSEIQSDAAALRALLLEDTLYADISRSIEIIEGNEAIFSSWKIDFIGVTLGYGGRDLDHTREELEALSAIATTLPGMSKTARRDLCRWLLLKDSLQSFLNTPSRLLVAARGVFLDGDIQSTLGMVGSGPSQELMREEDGQGQDVVRRGKELAVCDNLTMARSAGDNHLIHPCLIELCVRRLWTAMFELAAFGDTVPVEDNEEKEKKEKTLGGVESWMRCVRDLLIIDAFSIHSLLGNGCENCLSWTDSRLFCVMAAVAQIAALSGVSLSAFHGLIDIDYDGVSDLLRIALVLMSNAACELQVTGGLTRNTAKHRDLKVVLGHVMTSCLEWLFSVPHIITVSQSKEQLLYGLLDSQHAEDPAFITNATFDDHLMYAFSAITLNARCHFLDLLLSIDKEMEQRVSALLTSDPRFHGTYIPVIVTSAANTEEVQGLLKSRNRSPDPIPWSSDGLGAGVAPHELIFRIAFLSQMRDPDTNSVQKNSTAFIRAHRADRLDHPGPVSKIRIAARIVHLLNCVAELLSNGGIEQGSLLTQNAVTEAAATAIATAPLVWSMYLLSKLSNIGVVADLVQSEGLLNMLGMSWIYCERSIRSDMILAQEYEKRKKAKEDLTACLSAVSLSSALVTYHCQRLELLPNSSIVSTIFSKADKCIAASFKDNLVQRKAAEFVGMFAAPEMLKALAMNVHIPVVLSMHAFLRDRLAYRLTDISVARTLLVVEAIDKLPIDDRLLGRKLFRDFLEAWDSLRSHFRTFDICGREVQAARDIPALTPENTYVSMLVEMEGAEVHESLPAMIMETRLLKLTSQVLRHNALETLAADALFNQHEFLAGAVRTESVSCLSLLAPPQLLLTGPQDGHFDRIAAFYSTWIAHSDRPVMNKAISVNNDSAVRQMKDKMARDFQEEAHKMGMILCPRCGNRFERASGCEHVTCGNHENPYAGNGGLQPVAPGTCGMQLNANMHRVPAPIAGEPLLACFISEADTQHIPASLLGDDAPDVTPLPTPTGEYDFDWVAIAAHLLANDIRGRVDLVVDKGFFSPLPFALAASEDGASDGPNAVRSTARGAAYNLLGKGSERCAGDVYSRLRLAAEMVASELGDIVRNNNSSPKGATLRANATAVKSDKIRSIPFCFEVALTETQKNRIQQAASRQDERKLEELCDQAHTLCVGILALIGQGYFIDLKSVCSPAEMAVEYQLKSICKAVPPPPGVKAWSPLLMSIISNSPLNFLSPTLKCMAAVGAEGNPCSHSTLCANLPLQNRAQLTALQTRLIEEVKAETCDTAQYTDELQTISSLLTTSIDTLLNESVSKQLIDFAVISKYVKEHPNTLGTTVLARLQVKHYGCVVQYLRQTLGLIAYYSLLAAQLRYDLKSGKQGRSAGEAEGLGHTTHARDFVTETAPVTYRELVPDDWESLQINTGASINRELSIPAPALLLEEELVRVEIEEEGERWEIRVGSRYVVCNEVDGSSGSDASPPPAEQGDAATVTPPPFPPAAQLDLFTYEAAWTILQKHENSKNYEATSALLSDLGADDAESLGLLEEEHIRQLAALLKLVPSKRFLAALRLHHEYVKEDLDLI
jgi:hypothetical protein